MCGICGYYSFRNEISSKNVLEMSRAIQHRGSDDEGFWLADSFDGKSYSGPDSTKQIRAKSPLLQETKSKIALGFRRLSILDLSDNGHQPMISEQNKISITFNGEIYNFKKIRNELENLGFCFSSNTDTEVILKSYEAWGTMMFPKFDGMLAICLVDLKKQKIILARDRIGIKPLFYYKNNEALV